MGIQDLQDLSPADYPDPIVDHAAQRRRALMLYRRSR